MDRLSNRAIWLFYSIAFLESLYFYAPVASLYRLNYGVTLFQITIIESAFFLVTILLEMPWGFITARIGYKNTLVAAGAFNLLAAFLFWQAEGFGMFLIQRCLLAVAFSGFSGCDIAYLSRLSEHDSLHKVMGRYNAASFFALMIIGVIFPFVLPLGFKALAILTLLCTGTGFIMRLFLPKVEAEPQDKLTFIKQLKALWLVLKSNRLFILFVICGAIALVLLLPILRFAAQGYLPFEQLLKTQRTGGASRAVAISAYSMVASIVGIGLEPLLGMGADEAIRNGFITGFIVLLMASVVSLLVWRKISR